MKKIIIFLSLMVILLPGTALSFFDDFTGNTLSSDWIVKNENKNLYSVSNGYLHTQTNAGDLWENSNNYINLFLIENPYGSGDFIITMKVNNFFPSQNWQQIDIVAYDDDGNHVRCINGWVFDGRHWEFVYEKDGVGHNYTNGGYLQKMKEPQDDFYLRLVKIGNQYTQYYSYEGITFTQANGTITYGDGSPLYLGLIALSGSGNTYPPVHVDIDFFKVQPVPLPGAVLLFGTGLLGLGAWGWRRRS